jgi:drug/metabolite transporter (DMT)-like permease
VTTNVTTTATTATTATRDTLSVPKATWLVVLAACAFGSIPLFAILATRDGATLLPVLTWRYALAVGVLALVAGRGIIARENMVRSWPLVVFAGGAQAAIAYLSLSALEYISAATLSFLFYTYPGWVAAIAAVRRTEPLTPVRLGALALSLTGIVVMVGSPWAAPTPLPGLLLALGSAVMYAIYVPAVARMQQGIAPAAAATYISVGASLTYLVIGAATGALGNLLLPGMWAWLGAIGLALVSTVFGFIAFLRALPVLGSVRTAIICTVEPFYTAVAASLLFGQRLTASTVVGGVLIAAAVGLLQRGAAREATA